MQHEIHERPRKRGWGDQGPKLEDEKGMEAERLMRVNTNIQIEQGDLENGGLVRDVQRDLEVGKKLPTRTFSGLPSSSGSLCVSSFPNLLKGKVFCMPMVRRGVRHGAQSCIMKSYQVWKVACGVDVACVNTRY